MAEEEGGDKDIVSGAPGYRIEGGGSASSSPPGDGALVIEQVFDLQDNEADYFKTQFVERDPNHRTFVSDGAGGPYSLSLVQDDLEYKAILRTKNGNQRRSFDVGEVHVPCFRNLVGRGPDPSALIATVSPELPFDTFREVMDRGCQQALLRMEERQKIEGFKFGVLYAAENQTKEDEIFSNVEGSPEFEEFLDFLGDRIQLKNWENFRGGLDVKSGSTGETAVFTVWHNLPIIYHVSTMLPYNPQDKQQLEKKRHIGNDLVIIVWQQGNTKYRPSTISSRQVHVVFLVKAVEVADDPGQQYYQLAVISRDGVPDFGPPIDNVAIFKKGDEFRDLFYTKLMNAEQACYKAPMIDTKLVRTRTLLLKDVYDSFR
eukprot:CAMPEP_0201490566 /NCGR_PEP_ID=MMETSP0151_2-20130828/26638_1 /ASSEMBLY_ACC=CAM_ASM_000257 /TAXON_ID=200890 /ORGANISM="Paramoeba atlantica, Strain 621/1 / CCAP 1560/9" /LENGTH=372 /DNA_ID=CAMNT_0047876567 /DNA_START=133 /DNA_END=1251 /DNA_ORIENTATION=-